MLYNNHSINKDFLYALSGIFADVNDFKKDNLPNEDVNIPLALVYFDRYPFIYSSIKKNTKNKTKQNKTKTV